MPHPALAVLDAQRAAWNRGDLAGYLAACSPDVVYLNTRGPSMGREALAATMATAWPDPSAMGVLDLHVLRVDPLGPPDTDGASVVVSLHWTVTRAGSAVGGHALVVLRREAEAWWMTHDATVSAAPG